MKKKISSLGIPDGFGKPLDQGVQPLKYPPFYAMKHCAELICAEMELIIKDVVEGCEPIIGCTDRYVNSLAATVPAGQLIGCTSTCEIETEQDIKIGIDYTRACYKKGQHDINKWEIHGYPATNIEIINPPTNISTSSTTVNRIPDIINAEPGFIPVINCRNCDIEPIHYTIT